MYRTTMALTARQTHRTTGADMTSRGRQRKPGTGSIHRERNGRCSAYAPENRGARGLKIGQYGSAYQAEKALEKWLQDNSERKAAK